MHKTSGDTLERDRSGYGWISRDFQQLVAALGHDEERQRGAEQEPPAPHFDLLIVGSGYGGSVAAATFAGRLKRSGNGAQVAVRVGVLERGKEYLPGSFPAEASEVPGHIRIEGNEEGLFDIRLGPEVNTVVANGLGGGSLINAGVMEIPTCSVFGTRWPADLRKGTTLNPHYAELQKNLGSTLRQGRETKRNAYADPRNDKDNAAIDGNARPAKFNALLELAEPGQFRGAPITVALRDTVTSGDVRLDACIGCGDCATGCNFNAKISLDTNLLVSAHRQGAEIYTGATVTRIERGVDHWIVHAAYTNRSLRKRHGKTVAIRTRRLILAAGALGSTEILLRSRNGELKFSNALGHRCSTNGDMLVSDYATNTPVNTVADETVQPSKRKIGPTITGIIDLRDRQPPLVIEEMSVPAGLQRVFTEVFTTSRTFNDLGARDRGTHADPPATLPEDDIYTARPEDIEHTALYAVMGDDTAGGRVEIDAGDELLCDSTAHIRWPGVSQQSLFEEQVQAVAELTGTTGGKVLPNPAWRLLPGELSDFMPQRGPLVTVHPLGGCAMADDPINGVVDQYGRVYKPVGSATTGAAPAQPQEASRNGTSPFHDGLAVLDGAIVPTALGINPALTIAALARRAAKYLAREWHYDRDFRSEAQRKHEPLERPRFRTRETLDQPAELAPTQVRLTERLAGRIPLKLPGRGRKLYRVDLTLRFKPAALAELMRPGGQPTIELDQAQTDPYTDSRIRIFDIDVWNELNPRTSAETMSSGWAQLKGRLANTESEAEDPAGEAAPTAKASAPDGSQPAASDAPAQAGAAPGNAGLSPGERERRLDAAALYNAPLSGTLTMFTRKRTSSWGRVLRGGTAYLLNRGLRDIWQAFRDHEKGPDLSEQLSDWELFRRRASLRVRSLLGVIVKGVRLASHAGEVRLEEYELQVDPDPSSIVTLPADSDGIRRIRALKQFTYARRCNPWKQLMTIGVERFPGAPGAGSRLWRSLLVPLARFAARPRGLLGLPGRELLVRMERPKFSLDMDFLADIGVPMYEVTEQDNAVHGLAEFGSYAAWFIRMLAGIHLWTFRAPDRATRIASPERLPGKLTVHPRKSLRKAHGETVTISPEIHEIEITTERPHFEKDAEPVKASVRLTRYSRPESTEPPLVMIHGYSASGTSFSHPRIDPNFASYFYGQGRDVWIVDLRTSCGMPSANRGWSFEQVAFADIPAALCYVHQQTEKKVDVIAHCMGSAMFSMAVLQDGATRVGEDYRTERDKLSTIIHKVVLSQVGPLVVFSPANRFRGLLARFLTEFLPDRYSFNPGPEAALADSLLDRILYSIPYPDREFEIENPPAWRFMQRTPWVRTRHRMDALYGRAFNADQVNRRVLASIDDLFGPLSIQTVSQTIHFAGLGMITDVRGRNSFVSRENIRKNWTFDTLGIHGVENGLSDISTQSIMQKILTEAGARFRTERIEGAGHQDCLIGARRFEVLDKIESFLSETPGEKHEAVTVADRKHRPQVTDARSADVPWVGPIVTRHFSDMAAAGASSARTDLLTLRIGASPYYRAPSHVALLPVKVVGNALIDPKTGHAYEAEGIMRNMWLYQSEAFTKTGWDSFVVPPVLTDTNAQALLVLVIYPEAQALTTGQGAAAAAPSRLHSLVYSAFAADGFQPASSKHASHGRAAQGDEDESGADPEQRTTGRHAYFRLAEDGAAVALIDPQSWVPGDRLGEVDYWKTATNYVLERLRGDTDEASPAPGRPDRFTAADRSLLDGVVTCQAGAPGKQRGELSFALGSCQYQTSFLDAAPGYRSYARLAERLAGGERNDDRIRPQCLLLSGDQIYIDATAGLLDPSIKDDDRYDKPYTRWLRDRHVRTVLRQLPSFMMLDDHEIEDNWEPLIHTVNSHGYLEGAPRYTNGDGVSLMSLEGLGDDADEGDDLLPLNQRKLKLGRRAYLKYQYGAMRPGLCTALGLRPERSTARRGLSYTFRVAGHPFFMLDTRTGRAPRTSATIDIARLIAPADMAALKSWLIDPRNTGPKFVVSPAMILPRHKAVTRWQNSRWSDDLGALNSDGWDGYPATVKELLAYIYDHRIGQVVFLSGDEHRAIVAGVELSGPDGHSVALNSIHTSPAYAPFTFANSTPEQFSLEPFSFDHGGKTYRCDVDVKFPRIREGFTLFRTRPTSTGWELEYEFAGEPQRIPLGHAGMSAPPDSQRTGTLRLRQRPPAPPADTAPPPPGPDPASIREH